MYSYFLVYLLIFPSRVLIGLEEDRAGSPFGSTSESSTRRQAPQSLPNDWYLTMEIAQLLLSLLHGWSLDEDLDQVCQNRLGLAKPKSPVCFGLISRSGLYISKNFLTFLDFDGYLNICRTHDVDATNMARQRAG